MVFCSLLFCVSKTKMAKEWRCYNCGEVIKYGEDCPYCDGTNIPEHLLTPNQIEKLQYDGVIDEYYD